MPLEIYAQKMNRLGTIYLKLLLQATFGDQRGCATLALELGTFRQYTHENVIQFFNRVKTLTNTLLAKMKGATKLNANGVRVRTYGDDTCKFIEEVASRSLMYGMQEDVGLH